MNQSVAFFIFFSLFFLNLVSTTLKAEAPKEVLHLISIYESRSDHRGADYHPRGKVLVKVDTQEPTTLVLSSYEPTEWQIVTSKKTSIKKIILVGYYEPTVSLSREYLRRRHYPKVQKHAYIYRNSKIPANPFVPDSHDAFNGDYSGSYSDPWAQKLIEASQEATGLNLSSYSAAYRKNIFTLSLAPTNVLPAKTLNKVENFVFGVGFRITWDFPVLPADRAPHYMEIELVDRNKKPMIGFASFGGKEVYLDAGDLGTTLRYRVRLVYSEDDTKSKKLRGPWSRWTSLSIPKNLNLNP